MPPRKTTFQLGLETILNNKETSFLKNPQTFAAIREESKMPLSAMITHIGKGARARKGKKNEPTDEERSKARIEVIESKSATT